MNDPRDKLSKDFLEVARELVEAAKHAAETLIREFQLTHRKFARTEP